jgi:hypothetical protein
MPSHWTSQIPQPKITGNITMSHMNISGHIMMRPHILVGVRFTEFRQVEETPLSHSKIAMLMAQSAIHSISDMVELTF